MQNVNGLSQKLIYLKGPEIYFSKLMNLYEYPFKIEIGAEEFPRWAFEHELEQMKKSFKQVQLPLRNAPETNNKKIAKLFQTTRLTDRWVSLIELKSSEEMSQWSTMA